MATLTSNYDGVYANRWQCHVPARLILAAVKQPNFIWQKRASAPVYVAIHHHVRLLFE
jgi:hypothetical protein